MEIILSTVSILLIVAVFLSLIKNDFWIFKILEYPRLQKLALVALTIIGWIIRRPEGVFSRVLFALLVLTFFYLAYKI